ncbi:hypothetical protein M406DRAFT_70247 [Cryphonectria parasitica EP155]|uniref:Fungal N-terminal domain-containing protein n=1 Tax=Cryphonectria parasitica (strain ATCC 38755 / EP155) TaxID=660469 RepID=A0A9P5CRD8_CRYP1|nr:uncharacterized protein M406DRAFT_70247 [Cryphonectria parasitica EP155]KAF3768153.1 hypothetical protein M406DRAFT_70247 [Cryphonectria parasitica EP155]
MDPLSAGASVLAFVGVLNSLQKIYEILSSIKNGSSNVQLTTNSVRNLQSILQQLQRQESVTNPQDKLQVKQCADDVEAIAVKLEGFHIAASETRGGKIWKRVRAALADKDLVHINRILTNHASALSLRLMIQQRNIVVECRDQVLSLRSDIGEQQEKSDLQKDCPKGDSYSNKPPALQSQMDTILQILRRLQADVPARAMGQPAVVEINDDDSIVEESIEVSNYDQLTNAINELCLLIGDDECTIRSEDADKIIENLERLLSYANFVQLEPVRGAVETKDLDRRELSKDLRLLSGHVTSSAKLCINRGMKRSHSAGVVLHQKQQWREFDIGTGRVLISSTRRRRQLRSSNTNSYSGTSDKSTESDAEDFSAILAFLPSEQSTQNKMLTVSICQTELMQGLLSSIPCISVNRVRPGDSPVFAMVKDGDLDSLRKSLQQGTASIRDHDEAGRSLLSYATSQPEVCQFLVESGLDVDHVAPWLYDEEFLVPLVAAEPNDFGTAPIDLKRMNQCRRILLEAGADPSAIVDGAGGRKTPFEKNSIRVMLDNCCIDLMARDVRGESNTALLQCCRDMGYGDHRRTISFLLRRGADIHAVDIDGRSCLHVAIRGGRGPCCLEEEFAILVLLIKSGADVQQVDHCGGSISETAYSKKSFGISENNDAGSYRGDLWDSVLATCGYQVSDFRRQHPRVARYTVNYPRSMFLKLWEGQQDLCPYWEEDEAIYGHSFRLG